MDSFLRFSSPISLNVAQLSTRKATMIRHPSNNCCGRQGMIERGREELVYDGDDKYCEEEQQRTTERGMLD